MGGDLNQMSMKPDTCAPTSQDLGASLKINYDCLKVNIVPLRTLAPCPVFGEDYVRANKPFLGEGL